MPKKPTDELMNALKQSTSIEQYVQEQGDSFIDQKLSEALGELADEKGLSKGEAIQRSDINEIYGYQIFSGKRYPSRDKLLCMSVGMGLTIEEAQSLLKLAGYAMLYPKRKRDSIILFGLERGYTIIQINESLYDQGEATLN